MATTVERYLENCQKVVDAKPAYKNGASNLTECDCIGMDKYAFRECGVSFSTSGTNYSARNQVDNLRRISSASELKVGEIVFKAKSPNESGYNLPVKYRPGGLEYNGDLLDYYHIGTVKSVSPLRIIHMTSPTAKTDTKLGKWGYAAEWKKEYISNNPVPDPEPGPEPEPKTAVVYAPAGSTVNMRSSPKTSSPLVERVPIGETVDILQPGDEWCRVQWNGFKGYMQTRFLIFDVIPAPVYTVTISGLTKEQAEILCREYSNTELSVG